MNRPSEEQRPQGGQRQAAPGEARFEARDAPAGRAGLALVALAFALLLVCGAVAGLLSWFGGQSGTFTSQRTAIATPPEPRLQVDEHVQRLTLESRAKAGLRRRPGHIGIEQAKLRVARQGWPGGEAAR